MCYFVCVPVLFILRHDFTHRFWYDGVKINYHYQYVLKSHHPDHHHHHFECLVHFIHRILVGWLMDWLHVHLIKIDWTLLVSLKYDNELWLHKDCAWSYNTTTHTHHFVQSDDIKNHLNGILIQNTQWERVCYAIAEIFQNTFLIVFFIRLLIIIH